jgi:hypothetical protein
VNGRTGRGGRGEWWEIIVGDLWLLPMKNVNHGYIMAFVLIFFPSSMLFFLLATSCLLAFYPYSYVSFGNEVRRRDVHI